MGRTKNCPAYGKTCRHCHKLNHFQLMCRSKAVHDIDTAEENSDYYSASGCDNSFSYDGHKEHFIDVIDKSRVSTFSYSPDRAFVFLALGPKKIPVQFKIDAGSEVNIISCKVLDKLNVQTPLEAPECKLTSYSGDAVKVVGQITVSCSFKAKNQLRQHFMLWIAMPHLS